MDHNKMLDALHQLMVRTDMPINLKHTLKSYDKDMLLAEMMDVTDHYVDMVEVINSAFDSYRIKTFVSITAKYDRYLPTSNTAERTFNDLLGIRCICNDYSEADELKAKSKFFTMTDLRNGKKNNDDGYRGVHLHYQEDHKCYPIEIQFNTQKDRYVANILHDMLYKKEGISHIGAKIYSMYINGELKTEDKIRREINELLNRK